MICFILHIYNIRKYFVFPTDLATAANCADFRRSGFTHLGQAY